MFKACSFVLVGKIRKIIIIIIIIIII